MTQAAHFLELLLFTCGLLDYPDCQGRFCVVLGMEASLCTLLEHNKKVIFFTRQDKSTMKSSINRRGKTEDCATAS